MKSPKIAMKVLLLCLLLCPAFSGAYFDFDMYSIGAKGNGLGGAFVSLADDSSAVFWNPSGIVQQTSPVLCYLLDSQFFVSNPRNLLSSGFKITYDTPCLVSFIFPFNDLFHSTLAFSAQTPVQRKAFSKGRNLYIVQMGPTFGMMPFDKLSVGLNASFLVSQDLSSRKWGFGFDLQAGLLYIPFKFLRFGATVKPPFAVRWQTGSMKVIFPGVYQAGVTWKTSPRTTVSLELEYQDWNAFSFVASSGTNETPDLRQGIGYSILPHLGIQYIDRKSGAHFRLGLQNRSFLDGGKLLPQYNLCLGVGGRALKVVELEASLVDSYLLSFFNPVKQRYIETIQLTLEYKFDKE